MPQRSVKKKTLVNFFAAPLVLLALLLLSYVSFRRMSESNWWNEHTYKVMLETHGLLSSLINMETGMRGYITTGDRQFLQPYEEGKTEFQHHLQQALALTTDNPQQQERLFLLQARERSWLAMQESQLQVRRSGAPDAEVLRAFRSTAVQRKRAMDNMRSVLADMQETERTLLRRRGAEQDALQIWTALALASGGLFALGLTAHLSRITTRNTRALMQANEDLAREVSERKRAEEALDDTARRFRAIFNNTFQFTSLLNCEGTLLEANHTALDFGGVSREDVVGKPFWEARWWSIDAATREQLQAAVREAGNGVFVRYEVPMRGAGESIATLDFSLKPMFDGAGNVMLLIAEGRDITEQKEARQALHEVEERLRAIYESSKDAIVYSTIEGGLLDFNPAYCDLTGYSRDELLQVNWKEITPPEYSQFEAERVGRVLDSGMPEVYEKEYLRKDGSRVPVEVTAFLVRDAEGQPQGLAAIVSDITERKSAEESRQRSLEELKRSNAELEEFAYVASHDLQEPLRAISGCVQVLQRRYKEHLDSRADDLITHAVEGAQRMQNLINDLLAYSRVGTRGKPFEAVDCNKVVAAVLRSLRTRMEDTGAKVNCGELPTVVADESQLSQVFQNLLINAMKFRGEQPPEICVEATLLDNEWEFAVRDNGIGIEPQYFERIFVMFQRLHTRTEYSGTGIGLAICKKIIERHGGRIWVESQSGQGTTFHFTIPDRKVA